jgi:hypothetical protein
MVGTPFSGVQGMPGRGDSSGYAHSFLSGGGLQQRTRIISRWRVKTRDARRRTEV